MTIELSDYERDNLLALLHVALRSGAPLHTGDWTAQVYYKLAEGGFDPAVHHPNTPPDVQVADLRLWARQAPAAIPADASLAGEIAALVELLAEMKTRTNPELHGLVQSFAILVYQMARKLKL